MNSAIPLLHPSQRGCLLNRQLSRAVTGFLKSLGTSSLLLSVTWTIQVTPTFAQSPPVADAYRQLRFLSASTEAGISYVDFGHEWRKALGFINIALEDSKPGVLTKQLETIKASYQDIWDLWKCRFSSKYVSVALDHCLSAGFKQRNPYATESLRGALASTEYAEMDLPVSMALPYMFANASSQVRDLGDLLKGKKIRQPSPVPNTEAKPLEKCSPPTSLKCRLEALGKN